MTGTSTGFTSGVSRSAKERWTRKTVSVLTVYGFCIIVFYFYILAAGVKKRGISVLNFGNIDMQEPIMGS